MKYTTEKVLKLDSAHTYDKNSKAPKTPGKRT